MRSTSFASLVSFSIAIFAGCGSGGEGGVPSPSYSSSDAPPSANGTSTPAGKQGSAGILPGRVEPGSGSGLGAGALGGDCSAACKLIASCGGNQKDCLQACETVDSQCVSCIAGASCGSLNDCNGACGAVSTGAGGSSSTGQGAGGKGQGGSGSTDGTCHDLASCCDAATFPTEGLAACNQAVMSGQDKACKADLQSFRAAGFCP